MAQNTIRGATLGERLLNLRAAAGLTQEQVASALLVTDGAVSHWETGNWTPTLPRLKALAKLFDVSLDDLVRDHDEQSA